MPTKIKLTDEQSQKFEDLACQLSPENLSCDGEISKSEADREYRKLMKEWHALEKEVGRTVTEEEVWALAWEKER